ncbi:hypothetical protein X805_24160 [Sphaerotilus natans subsp. natans DSM 6575]|uniref:Phage portal protein n=1 Tax=Sphaerotilus natans subsp. natans DSM 6575 TaxID=1286631 RepID=A0A059KKT6_9BURK|nr:hypothetical protein [Sphaerotilus natans]KDB52046.1 hypothetical protein X805_24160 [Sphaerotilus natans subsp. natans DSM 6575]
MAKNESKKAKSWVATTATAVARLFGRGDHGSPDLAREVAGQGWSADVEIMSSAAASAAGDGAPLRDRQSIYSTWTRMLRDPIVSTAIKLHVTAALGGHETSGDVVFIEEAPGISDDDRRIVTEVRSELLAMLNRAAPTIAFRVAAYGDAYARLYQSDERGIVGIEVDETMLPALVQPYERAGETKLCAVAIGRRKVTHLTMDRIARFKAPRLNHIPQTMVLEKDLRRHVESDNPDDLPMMPSLAGGSFLADAEEQFERFTAAMAGLVGQRVLDSIDETIYLAQLDGATKEQQKRFMANLSKILTRSKEVALDAVRSGRPFLQRIKYIIPTFREKQVVSVQPVSGGGTGGRAGSVSIEDVLLHAKMLAGALGTDITMIGFADQMSGGLGEGGFFRSSAQAAERSRALRVALTDGFDHIIRLQVMLRHGREYLPGKEPWKVNYYGTISALESERQRTAADAMNTAAVMAQTLTQIRDLGLDEQALVHLLSKVMKLDEDAAKLYATALIKSKKAADAAGMGGPMGMDPPPVATGGTEDPEAAEAEEALS